MTELSGGDAFAHDEGLVERAESAIEELRPGFRAEVGRQIARLDQAFAALSADPATGRAGLFAAAHEIKGLAGAFGYELLAHVCECLCCIADRRGSLDRATIEAIGHHIVAVRAIAERDIRGFGGPLGRSLLRDLGPLQA